jgi:hypothetical protein
MRKVIAAFLLACLGIMLPTAATPVRVCFLEEEILIAAAGPDSKCCPDCTRETDESDPCCMDLEALAAAAAAPQPSIELPPAILTEVVGNAILAPLRTERDRKVFARPERIRGPTSPAAHRAVLGIWRL